MTKFFIRWLVLVSVSFSGVLPLSVHAMDMSVADNIATLSGPVVNGDLDKFQEALAAQPGITTVVLKNSFGGDASAGYRIGELIRNRSLTTVVSGYCVSSCSRMFLGGKVRLFSDDQGLSSTYVAFHGHYQANGRLNRQAVERMGLYDWIIKFSDGKADTALVQRWIAIEKNTGMTAENTRPMIDFRKYALGGGDIAAQGIPVIDRYRGRGGRSGGMNINITAGRDKLSQAIAEIARDVWEQAELRRTGQA